MRYAVIMAGGAGTRLWPLSRTKRPKQLLPLLEGRNLLDLAVERLGGMFEPENIYVITNAQYADAIAEALPQLPRANIVGEPMGRDTANAVALAAVLLAARDDDATMAVFTADHMIRPAERFAQAVNTACEAAEANPDALVTFGVRPTWPNTALGYVHCGKGLGGDLHEVLGFKEKPERHVARRYVESGQHYWNSGMFVWTLGAINSALHEFLPDSMARLDSVGQAVRNGQDYAPILAEVYPTLEKISVDFAIMERAHKVLMVELNCEWLDVGSWPSLREVTDLDSAGNVIVADRTAVLDSSGNVIVAEPGCDHLLAVLGVDDCIIVHSADATLVCKRSDSQRLKELIPLLKDKFGDKYE